MKSFEVNKIKILENVQFNVFCRNACIYLMEILLKNPSLNTDTLLMMDFRNDSVLLPVFPLKSSLC